MMDEGTTDYAVPESSLIALELVEGAYRSAREGRALKLPLADNAPATTIDWDPGMPYAGAGGGRDGRQFG